MPVLAFLIASTLIAQDAKVTPLMSKDLAECPGKDAAAVAGLDPASLGSLPTGRPTPQPQT